jgi:tetratricopeptide (TPR) repeat protein
LKIKGVLNMRKRLFICIALLTLAVGASAQKAERDYLRRGNRAFKDSTFVNAEIDYRKAIDANPSSAIGRYNLGNALLYQRKPKDAMEEYTLAAKIEKDKSKLAQIYHNMGTMFLAGKDYANAVKLLREALLNNPKDNETRYNYALAKKLLKNQQQQQQQNKDKQDQQKEQQQKEQEKKQEQKQQEQQKQEQQQQQQQNQMSKENAEQMLQSVMQDEKETQDKVKKQQVIMQGGKLEKDW